MTGSGFNHSGAALTLAMQQAPKCHRLRGAHFLWWGAHLATPMAGKPLHADLILFLSPSLTWPHLTLFLFPWLGDPY